MRFSWIFLFLLVFTTPAKAYFLYTEAKDDFSGEVSHRIYGASETKGTEYEDITIQVERPGSKLQDSAIIMLNTRSPYICGDLNNTVMLEWLVVASDGTRGDIHKDRWHLDRTKTVFFSSTKIDGISSNRLIYAMLKGDRLKFRYYDECGKGKSFEFNLNNFSDSVQQLEAAK